MNSQRDLYFRLKIKMATTRFNSQEELETKKTYNLSDSNQIAKYQLDYLFLDLFYSLAEDFLLAHNIIFDDFDVSCYTSPDEDYLIKISYLRTPWEIVQKIRETDNQEIHQAYINETELKDFYKKVNQDIPLVINFPIYDNLDDLIPILETEEQNKVKEFQENHIDDDEDEDFQEEAPIYFNFFLELQPKEMETERLLEIEFPVQEGDDDLSDSDISIDDLSEISLELEPENIVEEESNQKEDQQLEKMIQDCNTLENLEKLDNNNQDDDFLSDIDSDIDLENDPDFLDLKEEIEKRIS